MIEICVAGGLGAPSGHILIDSRISTYDLERVSTGYALPDSVIKNSRNLPFPNRLKQNVTPWKTSIFLFFFSYFSLGSIFDPSEYTRIVVFQISNIHNTNHF